MNTTEHLVELYYRQLGYFTLSDLKIKNGNNRQFDILAYNVKNKVFEHIEVNVAHGINWTESLKDIKEKFRFKFFGCPNNNRPDNPKTDLAKGKTYLAPIKEAYKDLGIDYYALKRVWCTWREPKKDETTINWKTELAVEFDLKPENFELLIFKDIVIPELFKAVGTANYEDELLRTLSLINEAEKQKEK